MLVKSLNEEGVCCPSYKEFVFLFEPLGLDAGTRFFKIGPGCPAFEFEEGKSYFRVFKLPHREGDYSIEITTLLVGSWIPKAHVFYPYLRFLDQNFDLTMTEVKPRLYFEDAWMAGVRWSGRVPLAPADQYVIIYTSPKLFDQKIPVPRGKDLFSSYGPAGWLRIKFVKGVD